MPECGKALRTRAGFAKTTLRDLRLCFTPKIAKCVTEGVATPRADPVGESSPLRSAAAAISFPFVPSARSFSPVSQAAVRCLPHRGRLCDSQAVEVGRWVQDRAGGWVRRAVTIGAYDLIRSHAQIGTRVMTHGWEKAFSRWRMKPIAPIVQSLRKSGRPALED